ncbi:MAG: hypothetical protein AABX52_00800 [Nanoarchaeota archaeon]
MKESRKEHCYMIFKRDYNKNPNKIFAAYFSLYAALSKLYKVTNPNLLDKEKVNPSPFKQGVGHDQIN